MKQINAMASKLNSDIQNSNKTVFNLLSNKGKAIFFPEKGILSQSAQAKGKEINATIGMALEDDNTPMVLSGLTDLIDIDKCKKGFAYASSFGDPDLRNLWASKIKEKNSSLKDKLLSTPVITNALTHGLSILGYMFLNENDNIVLPDLFWGNYKLIFANAYDANLTTFKTFSNNGFNIKGFEEALLNQQGDKVVTILNFPNNPAGYTPLVDEMIAIKEVLLKVANTGKQVLVITDDAYFGLCFEDNIIKESAFSFLSDLHENILAVKIDGATKEDYVWGFRVGFITYGIKNGSKELYTALEKKTAGAIRGNISNAPNIAQQILLSVYKNENYQKVKQQKFDTLKNRYMKVKEILQNNPDYTDYFDALPFNSGYFMCIELKNLDAESVRQVLLDKYSVGLIAIGKILRVAFSATPLSKLEALFDRIYKACQDVSQ